MNAAALPTKAPTMHNQRPIESRQSVGEYPGQSTYRLPLEIGIAPSATPPKATLIMQDKN